MAIVRRIKKSVEGGTENITELPLAKQGSKAKRIFLGTFVSKEIKDLCSTRIAHEKLRWTPLENLHMTWQFMGKQDESVVSDVKKLIEEIKTNYFPIAIDFKHVRIWPHEDNPKQLVWVGEFASFANHDKSELEKTKKFFVKDLRSRLEKICEFESVGQLVPHITLGRFQKGTRERDLKFLKNFGLPQTRWKLEKIDLIESVLNEEGSKYKIL